MSGYQFTSDNMAFHPAENPMYPDEIEITIVHTDSTESNKNEITNGVYIFLDNYLGELNFATTIDYLSVEKATDERLNKVPINKLKDYLNWRQKEFIEKYDGVRQNTENDKYATFEAQHDNGNTLVAIMNTKLLSWDSKASHPWIMKVDIKYNDSGNGFPDDSTYELMNEIEEKINLELRDSDGYLNVGRETANGLREVYYACNDFRKSSKVLSQIIQEYANRLEMSYDIYKDKYWRTFNQFYDSQ